MLRSGVVCLCGMLVAGQLAAGTSNDLETLKTGYALERARISVTHEQQKTNALAVYRQAIASQMVAAKKNGDLERYLVLETEKKRMETQDKISADDVPELEPHVAQCQKSLQAATSARDKAIMTALRQYVDRLTTLMQNYTRTDRLEDAKIVRDEMREARSELTFLEADTPKAAPVPTPSGQPSATPPQPPASAADDIAKSLAGTWKITWRDMSRESFETLVFDEDGTFCNQKNPYSKQDGGKWEVKGRQWLIHMADKEVTLNLTASMRRLLGHSRQGTPVTAVKIAEPVPKTVRFSDTPLREDRPTGDGARNQPAYRCRSHDCPGHARPNDKCGSFSGPGRTWVDRP
ncbi:MAG: hypothetical protein WCR06_09710 [bacterium]